MRSNIDARYNRPAYAGGHSISFRRNDQGRRPPSRVLTGALLGDPQPDRFEKSEAIRARLGMKAKVTGSIPDKIIPTLRAIADWPLAPGELADALGLAQSSCDERVKIAVGLGLAARTGSGRNRRIALTGEGRVALEALPQ